MKQHNNENKKPLKVVIESAKGEDFTIPISPELIKEFQEILYKEFCLEGWNSVHWRKIT